MPTPTSRFPRIWNGTKDIETRNLWVARDRGRRPADLPGDVTDAELLRVQDRDLLALFEGEVATAPTRRREVGSDPAAARGVTMLCHIASGPEREHVVHRARGHPGERGGAGWSWPARCPSCARRPACSCRPSPPPTRRPNPWGSPRVPTPTCGGGRPRSPAAGRGRPRGQVARGRGTARPAAAYSATLTGIDQETATGRMIADRPHLRHRPVLNEHCRNLPPRTHVDMPLTTPSRGSEGHRMDHVSDV